MDNTSGGFEEQCRQCLDRFFKAYPNAELQGRADKALRLLRTSEKSLKGKSEGWAAGIIYFVATDATCYVACPDVLNAEFEQLMNVSMETARYRAARIKELAAFQTLTRTVLLIGTCSPSPIM